MLIHSVYFFLKPELSAEQVAAFKSGLESLRGCADAEQIFIGSPAPVPARPVIEKGYAFGLTVLFKDLAAHDRYQVDPLHKAFLGAFNTAWTKVMVFDTL